MTQDGVEPATIRFVAQHLNHCATAVPRNRAVERAIMESCSICNIGVPKKMKKSEITVCLHYIWFSTGQKYDGNFRNNESSFWRTDNDNDNDTYFWKFIKLKAGVASVDHAEKLDC